ncbi:unnamed protein product [Scytosiphon promiscuus]
MAGVGLVRLGKELKMLTDEPPPGVCAWPVEDCMTHLQAQIQGPEDTPYERGTFLLDLQIPDRYPFEPPKVRFLTPIYHPNIDSGGRICLDTLKMRPAGSWAPSMNVPTLLTTIRLLMAHPNGDDGLMPDITELFLKNPSRFADVARAHVEEHARQGSSARSSKVPPPRPAAVVASKPQVEGGSSSMGTKDARSDSSPSTASEKQACDSLEKERQGQDKQDPAARVSQVAAKKEACSKPPTGGDAAAPPLPEGSQGEVAGASSADVDRGASDAKGGEDAAPARRKNESCATADGGRDSNGRGGEGSAGSDLDGGSSEDGAWSDSDEDGGDDGGPASAKRARRVP